MARFIDLTGKQFDRLCVIKRVENNKYGNSVWLCQCDCGVQLRVRGDSLIKGNTKSCGCLRKEKVIERAKTHGKTNTKCYMEWANMKARCYNPNSKQYKDYGGRGITMCERWRKSFEAFYADVSELPNFGKEGYSINRIDNNGNYEPNNVEWADDITQANNKRNNHLITYNGKTQSLSQWAAEKGLKRSTLEQRINKYHWNIEKALTTPAKNNKVKHLF